LRDDAGDAEFGDQAHRLRAGKARFRRRRELRSIGGVESAEAVAGRSLLFEKLLGRGQS
jgi:hypothetical protein